jgi:hypothetical protein
VLIALPTSTPWSRVLEKLTGYQVVKKFPAFYGNRRSITAFNSAELTTLPHSCADFLEIWESQPNGTLWDYNLLV